MKKRIFIGIICLTIFIGVTFLVFGFKKKDDNNLVKIKLAEVTHSSFYSPLYVAIEKGYFKEEGIDLELVLTPGADKVSAAVLSNDVEIGFAGAESAIYVYKENEDDYLQLFAGLTKRDGQFIVARDINKDFKLTDLYGKEILVGRSTGMPALNFLNALKNENIDINKINVNYSVEFSSLSGSFIGGVGDYVNLFEPNATLLQKNNYGKVVASVGKMSGEVPYTAFNARKSFIENNPDTIKGFTNAIQKGLDYVHEHTDEEVASVILSYFPDTSLNDLTKIVKRYRDNDSWFKTTFISEDDFNHIQDIMKSAGELEEFAPYKDLVDNSFSK